MSKFHVKMKLEFFAFHSKMRDKKEVSSLFDTDDETVWLLKHKQRHKWTDQCIHNVLFFFVDWFMVLLLLKYSKQVILEHRCRQKGLLECITTITFCKMPKLQSQIHLSFSRMPLNSFISSIQFRWCRLSCLCTFRAQILCVEAVSISCGYFRWARSIC